VEFTYNLAETRVRISGSVTRKFDTILESASESLDEITFSWETIGDEQASRTLRTDKKFLSDLELSLSFTDDRRLTSVSVSTTSAADEALGAAAKLVGIGVGATIGGWPAAAMAAGVATKRLLSANLGIEPTDEAADDPLAEDEAEIQPEDKVAEAYSSAHAMESAQAAKYLGLSASVMQALLETRIQVVADPSDPELATRKTRLSQVAREVDAELTRLKTHFEAWRSGTFDTTTESIEALLEMRQLPFLIDGELRFSELRNTQDLSSGDVWDTLGVCVARFEDQRPVDSNVEEDNRQEGIWIRQAHWRQFALVARKAGKVEVTSRFQRFVLDDGCREEYFPWEDGLFRDRKLGLEFSDLARSSKARQDPKRSWTPSPEHRIRYSPDSPQARD
jgi:hypothetical protein